MELGIGILELVFVIGVEFIILYNIIDPRKNHVRYLYSSPRTVLYTLRFCEHSYILRLRETIFIKRIRYENHNRESRIIINMHTSTVYCLVSYMYMMSVRPVNTPFIALSI